MYAAHPCTPARCSTQARAHLGPLPPAPWLPPCYADLNLHAPGGPFYPGRRFATEHNAALTFRDAMRWEVREQLEAFRLASVGTSARGAPVYRCAPGLADACTPSCCGG